MRERLNPPRKYMAFKLDPALREQVIRTAIILNTTDGDVMERCIRVALPNLISDTIARMSADNARSVKAA